MKLHIFLNFPLQNTFSNPSVKFSLVALFGSGNVFKDIGLQLPFETFSIEYMRNIFLPRYFIPKKEVAVCVGFV